MPRCAEAAIASWRPHTAAAPGYESAAEVQGPPGLARQGSIARCDSASSQAFQQHSTVHPLTGLPPQPNAPMHAPLRRYDSDFEGVALHTNILEFTSDGLITADVHHEWYPVHESAAYSEMVSSDCKPAGLAALCD